MRLIALTGIVLSLSACATVEEKSHPFAEANSLVRQEIQARIANIPFQHRQELLNNLLWLATRGGEPAIPDLLTALQHAEPKVRSSAAWVLGRLRDRRVVANLRPLVMDENHSVRFEAARSLTLMGDMQHATMLIEGLDSDKVPVRYNCHMALRDATGRDFQYDHLEDDVATRRVAVLRWREWWGQQIAAPNFAKNYATMHKLTTPAAAPVPATPLVETTTAPGVTVPTTAAPTAAVPTTAAPTTTAPTTAVPTTAVPTTTAPTTTAPTTTTGTHGGAGSTPAPKPQHTTLGTSPQTPPSAAGDTAGKGEPTGAAPGTQKTMKRPAGKTGDATGPTWMDRVLESHKGKAPARTAPDTAKKVGSGSAPR